MRIETSKSLQPFNTFRIPSTAAHYIAVQDLSELRAFLASGFPEYEHLLVLGGGSNLLFTGDFDGLVLHMLNKGIEILSEDGNGMEVRVQAGEVWDDFVTWCTKRNLYGVENLVAIPGSVGAAPVQNIGAYGAEVKDVIVSVDIIMTEDGRFKTLPAAACEFGYRSSIFKQELRGQAIITSVVFRLQKSGVLNRGYGEVQKMLIDRGVTDPGPAEVAEVIRLIRSAKLPDPAVTGNAGSFFKNPLISDQQYAQLASQYPNLPSYPQHDGTVKVAAGWMIEQCGLKGHRMGNAAVHDKQALVLINAGGATGFEVVALANHIIKTVWLQFGIRLEPEVNIL
jgi:UDP-N-acetylmuramate dehydrogenase